ncbi:hypothetical protein BD769DRAFT_1703803 [Suillus cothurnatus]|nr:hypothetical protein BD769DRAFT_1703803 [Suillus cothurnatus]
MPSEYAELFPYFVHLIVVVQSQAQLRKDDLKLNDKFTQSIQPLNSLAQKLKAKLMAAGMLNLASPR